jgi:hypothetical protein
MAEQGDFGYHGVFGIITGTTDSSSINDQICQCSLNRLHPYFLYYLS